MRAPEIIDVKYQFTSVGNTWQEFRTVQLPTGTIGGVFPCVEIDPGSDVYSCILIDQRSREYYIAPGAPAVGEIIAPFQIKFSGYHPYGTIKETLNKIRFPSLRLRCHNDMPPAFVMRRAPRRYVLDANTFGASLTNICSFPWYGRRLAEIGLVELTANGFNFSIRGFLGASTAEKDMTGTVTIGAGLSTIYRVWDEDMDLLSIYGQRSGGTDASVLIDVLLKDD